MLRPLHPILAHRRSRSQRDRHRNNTSLRRTYSLPWFQRDQKRPALSTSRATIYCYLRSMKDRSASSSARSPSTCAKWCLTCTVTRACPTLARSRAVCGPAEQVQPSKFKRWPTVTSMTLNLQQRTILTSSPCRARETAQGSTWMGSLTEKWRTRWRPFTTSVDKETIANWYVTPRGKPRGPASSLRSRKWQVIRMVRHTSLAQRL